MAFTGGSSRLIAQSPRKIITLGEIKLHMVVCFLSLSLVHVKGSIISNGICLCVNLKVILF